MARLTFEHAIAFSLIIANARIDVKLNFFIILYFLTKNIVIIRFPKFSKVIFCQYFLFSDFLEYVYFFNRMCSPSGLIFLRRRETCDSTAALVLNRTDAIFP